MRALFSKYGLVVLSVLLLNSAYAEVTNYTSGVAQPASSEEENYYKVVKGVMTYKVMRCRMIWIKPRLNP